MAKKKRDTKSPMLRYDLKVTNEGRKVILRLECDERISFDEIHAILDEIEKNQTPVDNGLN